MILMIDNYDSFTYNLFQYFSELGAELTVVRNDRTTVEEIDASAPAAVVISPGPSTPERAGISNDVVRHFAGKVPVLGVCLGHQCIGYSFGARVSYAGEIMHGKSSPIHHTGQGVLAGLPDPFEAIRYHSLAIEQDSLPECLEVTAWTDRGIIMGVRHREYEVEGIQFHPESIKTDVGKDILRSFLRTI